MANTICNNSIPTQPSLIRTRIKMARKNNFIYSQTSLCVVPDFNRASKSLGVVVSFGAKEFLDIIELEHEQEDSERFVLLNTTLDRAVEDFLSRMSSISRPNSTGSSNLGYKFVYDAKFYQQSRIMLSRVKDSKVVRVGGARYDK